MACTSQKLGLSTARQQADDKKNQPTCSATKKVSTSHACQAMGELLARVLHELIPKARRFGKTPLLSWLPEIFP